MDILNFLKKKTAKKLPHDVAMRNFLRAYNCKYTEEKGDDYERLFFDFQGGHFVADVKPYGIEVIMPSIEDIELDQINLVRALCNRFNNTNTVMKFYYNHSTEDYRLRVSMSFFVNSIDNEQMSKLLNSCFYFQREFTKEYDGAKSNAESLNSDDVERAYVANEREHFLLREQEVYHDSKEYGVERASAYASQVVTIHDLVRTLLRLDNAIYKSLTVATAQSSTTITDGGQIHDYDVTRAILEGEGEEAHVAHDFATLTLQYFTVTDNRVRTYAITITPEGGDNNTLYVRVTTMLAEGEHSRINAIHVEGRKPLSSSFLIAYDKRGQSQQQQEFNFMWLDAIDKSKNNEALSDEQKFIVDVANGNVAYNMYWGRRYFDSGMYLQALRHLEHAFDLLKMDTLKFNSDQSKKFRELCYLIGFSHSELHNYRDAYYFLSFLRDDGSIKHQMEFVNTLTTSNDVRLFSLTDDIAQAIREQYRNSDDMPETVQDFFDFMRRRRIFSLIEFGMLDEAEEALKAILDNNDDGENRDFAISEMAYLQRLRKKQEAQPADTPPKA